VKCYLYGGDESWGVAKKSVNGAGAGMLVLDITAPTTGVIQVMVPLTFNPKTFTNYGMDHDY